MTAIRFGALQQRKMPQTPRDGLQGIEQVPQHRLINRHLLGITPTGDQIRFFEQCGKKHVRDLRKIAQTLTARVCIREVDADMANALRQGGSTS